MSRGNVGERTLGRRIEDGIGEGCGVVAVGIVDRDLLDLGRLLECLSVHMQLPVLPAN